jgi:hypothetical protein
MVYFVRSLLFVVLIITKRTESKWINERIKGGATNQLLNPHMYVSQTP